MSDKPLISNKSIDNIIILILFIFACIVFIMFNICCCYNIYKSHYRSDSKEDPLIKKVEKENNEKI
jgi:hypothetical protein